MNNFLPFFLCLMIGFIIGFFLATRRCSQFIEEINKGLKQEKDFLQAYEKNQARKKIDKAKDK